jgi:hypothetical protein
LQFFKSNDLIDGAILQTYAFNGVKNPGSMKPYFKGENNMIPKSIGGVPCICESNFASPLPSKSHYHSGTTPVPRYTLFDWVCGVYSWQNTTDGNADTEHGCVSRLVLASQSQ